MRIVKLIKSWVDESVGIIADFLAPEDIKIQKLLALPAGAMRDLLPKSPVYSKDIFVLFDYQNKIVRLIVKSIKYKNNYSLRKRIAAYLYEEIVDISTEVALFHGAPPILVPMPMEKNEKRNRGFNQCEELVREIKRIGCENIEASYDILKKMRETKRQTKLSREERLKNVKNSMRASFLLNTRCSTKTVIVLDDVYTTGASLLEARRALLSAGYKRVIGLFIAH